MPDWWFCPTGFIAATAIYRRAVLKIARASTIPGWRASVSRQRATPSIHTPLKITAHPVPATMINSRGGNDLRSGTSGKSNNSMYGFSLASCTFAESIPRGPGSPTPEERQSQSLIAVSFLLSAPRNRRCLARPRFHFVPRDLLHCSVRSASNPICNWMHLRHQSRSAHKAGLTRFFFPSDPSLSHRGLANCQNGNAMQMREES